MLIDNVHGADAFGTALYALGDLSIVIASPTRKSREILASYLETASQVERDIGITVPIAVVGNRAYLRIQSGASAKRNYCARWQATVDRDIRIR